MNDALLLDTHIVLWLDAGDDRLRRDTRVVIDECRRNGGTIFFSTVSAWEIALLVDTGRIDLDIPVEEWVERFVRRPGIVVVPLSHRAACRSYQLHPLPHRDPADRLLVATAIDLGCPLVTYDDRILAFGARYGSQYRFAVGA
ncbi:MAG TPA: type II toxin-antitoxin system VapC family toxin [Stellaceae bacterium]|jgi:PIN domain nuclease of toxin-antitoxin system|nr:type II toxin-antitoxin system VapC family toxin [Stellaceae bacterium]